MKETRFMARQRLKQATKAEFENLVIDANLTPIQEQIIKLHIVKGYSICKLSRKVFLWRMVISIQIRAEKE